MEYYETLDTMPITGRGDLIFTYNENPDGTRRKPPQHGDVILTIFGPMKVTGIENWLTYPPKWTGGILGKFL